MKELATGWPTSTRCLPGASLRRRRLGRRASAPGGPCARGGGRWRVGVPAAKAEKVLNSCGSAHTSRAPGGARRAALRAGALAALDRMGAARLVGPRRSRNPPLLRSAHRDREEERKTFLAATLALFELRFGDAGAEVWSTAVDGDQAKIVWEGGGGDGAPAAGLCPPRHPRGQGQLTLRCAGIGVRAGLAGEGQARRAQSVRGSRTRRPPSRMRRTCMS